MHFELQDVSVSYSGIPAIRNVSFTYNGGTVVLTGPSGAGKTTVLRLLMADILPTSGKVLVEGAATQKLRGKEIRLFRKRVGIVHQHCRFVSVYTVYQNVLLPLGLSGLSRAEANKRCLEQLADLGISYVRNKLPHQLSGGERQLAAIARALVARPDVVIADEPTGTLDDVTTATVINVLKKVASENTGVILSTHSSLLTRAFTDATTLRIYEGTIA
ncbi:MAG: ATP-binding cassette domain-containing protein [bacterium]|nr:ATP-binding cassette domain-containing protein [bacterium]